MKYPEDVMEAARKVVETMRVDEPVGHIVARAILAERERCATQQKAAPQLIPIADHKHPAPWSCGSTRFGESMGYNSNSNIVDANGRSVICIGNGVHAERGFHEQLARLIVSEVNKRSGFG